MHIARRAVTVFRNEGVLALARKGLNYVEQRLQFFTLPYMVAEIRKFNAEDRDLDTFLDFSFNRLVKLIRPAQVRDEMLQLLEIVNGMKPKVVLEVGTGRGGTLFLLSHVASKDAMIISLDLPGGMFGHRYPIWKIPLYKSFALFDQEIHLVRTDSHARATLEKVTKDYRWERN